MGLATRNQRNRGGQGHAVRQGRPMSSARLPLPVIEAATACIRAHADLLTELDQAIGDGDHGSNMRRGFDAVAAQAAALSELEPGDALQKAGMVLVSTVGGASGPLYGTLFMSMGKALKAGASFTDAFAEGVE